MRRAISLPGVDVRDASGGLVPSALRSLETRGLVDKDEAYHIVKFDLVFLIEEIAPQSWMTYFASYATAEREPDPRLEGASDAGLIVLESLCRKGPLPASGTFDKLSPFVLY